MDRVYPLDIGIDPERVDRTFGDLIKYDPGQILFLNQPEKAIICTDASMVIGQHSQTEMLKLPAKAGGFTPLKKRQ
ncbi:MAG: hypothetical protein LBP92_03660 [Deltaproteobacteria bacterium]|nr:hypothetical protein [Deltaproteobacteria bacterium]